jgi:hypothetical protein
VSVIPRSIGSWKTSPFLPRISRFGAAFLAALCVVPSSVFASFEQLPTGGRQAGLGNAFVALADDVYSAYYNPAGLVQVKRSEFTAFYSRLYAGLSDNSSISRSYVGYAHPLRKYGTLGFSFLSLDLSGLYSESTMALHYAHAVREKWNLGGSLKFLRKSFGSDPYTQSAINSDTGASLGGADPLFAQNGTSKSGMALDVGAQYRLSKIYGLGFAIQNINSPNMALSSSDSDKVSSVFTAGIARRTKVAAIDVDVSRRQFTSDDYRLNIGAERWLTSGIGFRGGLGFGSRGYQVTSMGFSYKWENAEFDYGLIYPLSGIQGTFGTHQLTVTFRFGRRS